MSRLVQPVHWMTRDRKEFVRMVDNVKSHGGYLDTPDTAAALLWLYTMRVYTSQTFDENDFSKTADETYEKFPDDYNVVKYYSDCLTIRNLYGNNQLEVISRFEELYPRHSKHAWFICQFLSTLHDFIKDSLSFEGYDVSKDFARLKEIYGVAVKVCADDPYILMPVEQVYKDACSRFDK